MTWRLNPLFSILFDFLTMISHSKEAKAKTGTEKSNFNAKSANAVGVDKMAISESKQWVTFL